MTRRLVWSGLAGALAAIGVAAQVLVTAPVTLAADGPASLAGKWTYRSFHNNPAFVADDPPTAPQKALALIFAEATFTFEVTSDSTLKGAIDWGSGGLDLTGTIRAMGTGEPLVVEIVGNGRPNTGTDGWEYDYYGYLAHKWSTGVNQVPALVGSVIRAKPHGNAPAGYVASFIAVKQP